VTAERTVSVVVPAYNEERRLPALLELFEGSAADVLAVAGLELHELIVVDDGSSDGTPRILDARAATLPFLRVIRFERNRGKGAAVRAGMLAASGGYALITDVDLATPLEDAGLLSTELERGFDIAIGSRGLPASTLVVRQRRHRELMGRAFNRMLRALTGLPFHDTQCGFKLFRLDRTRTLFELQRVEGFAYDVELLVIARRLGLLTAEVPVHWSNDERTTVGLLSAPLAMTYDLLKIAWLARRPGANR
jgi:dolichyl-phosphate beta-glucosyltransferase